MVLDTTKVADLYFVLCFTFFKEIVNKSLSSVHYLCRINNSYTSKEFFRKELHIKVPFIAVHIYKIDCVIVCIIASHSAHNDDR